MKKKVFFRGPLLTRSGYGEQSRFALRALKSREDLFDIYIQPLQWGKTSWMNEDSVDREWIDYTIEKTIAYAQQGGQYDASFQVTIPNEWERIAPVNVGYTAGIETTKVAHQWIPKGNEMDEIVVVSDHARDTYKDTVYTAEHTETKQKMELKLTTPIRTVNYPAKVYENLPDIELDLDFDFNFLTVAQAGPRKNLPQTVNWFVQEFQNDEVGLVLKTNIAKNSLMDREKIFHDLKSTLNAQYPNRKCKIYLLHGDMTDEEMHSLYAHPKIKALLALTHGEGFGLPLFECCYTGVPVICAGWSGQLDFLYDKETNKNNFYSVEYDLQPVPDPVVWEGVIIKESMWAYPREKSAKEQMRLCYNQLTGDRADEISGRFVDYADKIHKTFAQEKRYAEMVQVVCDALGVSSNPQEEDVVEFD